jgi:GT2 family glycosyltransferase
VVVADDGSRDGSVEELQRRFPQVRLVRSARRRGCSPTKDAAARAARGKVLVFLDGHCKPEPGAIARLVADVERLSGRAIVTPSVPALSERRWRNSTSYVAYGFRFELETLNGSWMDLDDMDVYRGLRNRRMYKSPNFVGCCVAMSRGLYEKLWGFDPDMRCWGSEDVDLGLKAWLMGYPVLHDPRSVIGHRFRVAFDNYSVPMPHVAANTLRMARKCFTDPVWKDWLRRAKARHADWPWEKAWRIFASRRASVERERSYLMRNRVRDEFWYAAEFGLTWPDKNQLNAPGDPSGNSVRRRAGRRQQG